MSMYYAHLLVPLRPNFVFDAASMVAFLEAIAEAGFVGSNAERFVVFLPEPEGRVSWHMSRDLPKTGKYRGTNPGMWVRPESRDELLALLSRCPEAHRPPQRRDGVPGPYRHLEPLDPVLDFPGRGENVNAAMWSELRPSRAPLIELQALQHGDCVSMDEEQFDDCYYVTVTCHRMAAPVSMSDDGHYTEPSIAAPFGEPMESEELPPFAVANFPHKAGRIEVAGIPAARSWVGISFGNYVFPANHLFEDHLSEGDGLAFAVPEFVALAEDLLGCSFRQTCAWG
jgi:hypothetical protein